VAENPVGQVDFGKVIEIFAAVNARKVLI